MTELFVTIIELIYDNNKDYVTQNSKQVYGEHQQIIENNTWNFTRSPGDGQFCRHVYFHCNCI